MSKIARQSDLVFQPMAPTSSKKKSIGSAQSERSSEVKSGEKRTPVESAADNDTPAPISRGHHSSGRSSLSKPQTIKSVVDKLSMIGGRQQPTPISGGLKSSEDD